MTTDLWLYLDATWVNDAIAILASSMPDDALSQHILLQKAKLATVSSWMRAIDEGDLAVLNNPKKIWDPNAHKPQVKFSTFYIRSVLMIQTQGKVEDALPYIRSRAISVRPLVIRPNVSGLNLHQNQHSIGHIRQTSKSLLTGIPHN